MAETIETLGKYEIKRTLGKGAMGTVYEGWDPIIARRVAIKTVRIPETHDDPETAEALARFRREAQAAGRLTHPNIVGVFDYGETGAIAYIVMEYVDGPSVKSLVDKQQRFAIPDTMRIMTDLLNGLQFSHARGVVHRDIKPANVMLTTDGQAKIADFGIARIESSSMTQAGTVLGTPAYMSPEQFMGQVVDARTDIYSSGVLLYQLLTGERPFEGGMSAIMHKALNTDPPRPSQISVTCPAAFDAVVRKAMAKRPEERFQSAAAFLDALQSAAAVRPVAFQETDEAHDPDATVVATTQRRPAASATPAGRTAVLPSGASRTGTPTADRASGATSAPRAAGTLPAATIAGAAPRRSNMPILAAAAVLLLLLLGGGTWFFLLPGAVSRGPATGSVAPLAQNTSPTAPSTSLSGIAAPTSGSTQSTQPGQEFGLAQTTQSPTPGSPTAGSSTSGPITPGQSGQIPGPVPTTQSSTPGSTLQSSALGSAGQSSAPGSTTQAPGASQQLPAASAADNGAAGSAPQLASAGLDIIRQQVAQLVAGQGCALVDGDVRDGGNVALDGLAGAPAADALRQALGGITQPGAVDWRVNSVDPVFCPVLDTLHPIVPVSAAAGARLQLSLADGKTRLSDSEHILPRLVMPDFRGNLRVDYIDHGGTVLHLYPQVGDPKQRLTADTPRVFGAGEAISLGDPAPGHRPWEVGPPYGTDMIIAIASSQPLFDRSRPDNVESEADYIRALQAALGAAQRRGVRLTGNVMTVDTIEK